MGISVLVLVVVYGERPESTASFRSLSAAVGNNFCTRVLLWDNSPQPQPLVNSHPAWVQCLSYVSTPENLGLSTIYNRVIKQHLQDSQYLLILDQDSLLPADFLTQIATAIATHPEVDLFLPMVRANERWVSPLTYFNGWGRYWTGPRTGLQEAGRCSAINSGMLVSARYLKGDFPGYDERLRFYGTDTQFMVTYASQRRVFGMLDTVIQHDLSFFSSKPDERCRKFLTMKSAYRWIYENHPWYRRLTVTGVMVAVSLLYALRYRSSGFLARG